mmetsp:Transcript_1211/g.3592  ORF Transcript_1211/g.3592 Transcript_1211/m.3592 type:complete len:129 (-) Transcript_1211:370-756(-)|eukprot:CAMPEP_0206135178 /NCGR_PEP_ID=MMETSP1473-20131121/520_1 /ASSEMBLY_ACC=CAM_ASM_001109 /TAXON_ID=1461547 /ORGANISM="Stichococcus sp, Strain RCC1054" /LENGTH=128 /DNA_ID=CAMNT_0053526937 /DNA_START=202 /DNA_END=588 /DNA_ORIENTATION=+
MGWFGWGGGRNSTPQLSEEQRARVQRKLRPEAKAYRNCLRANHGDGSVCEQLERRLLELWCQAVAPEAAAAFQLCYTTSLERNDEVMDSCSEQVEAMRKSLAKLGVDSAALSDAGDSKSHRRSSIQGK